MSKNTETKDPSAQGSALNISKHRCTRGTNKIK